MKSSKGGAPPKERKEVKFMKKYSVSYARSRDRENNKVKYHYDARTDNVEETIAKYRGYIPYWAKHITDENYEYRNQEDDFYGIRITDSQTKKVVFEECHVAEEYGYKKVFTYVKTEWGGFYKGEWVKL